MKTRTQLSDFDFHLIPTFFPSCNCQGERISWPCFGAWFHPQIIQVLLKSWDYKTWRSFPASRQISEKGKSLEAGPCNYYKKCFCCSVAKLCPTLAAPWTVAHQAALSVGFSQARILEWVAITQRSNLSPAWEVDSFPLSQRIHISNSLMQALL